MKKPFRLQLLLVLGSIAAALMFAAPVIARPLAQEPTPYEEPTYEIPTGYPNGDLTPYVEPGQPSPTPSIGAGLTRIPGASPTSGTPDFAPSPTFPETPSASPTPGRNLFGTEDAEMGAARITPPASETPSPNDSPTPPPVATAATAHLSPFDFNRGWFAVGILLPPFILLCGWLIFRARRSGEFG